MPNDAPIRPPNPLLRFRLRTVLALTTGLALAAAVAAPYFRRQSPVAQSNLLLFRAISLVLIGAGFAWRMRQASRAPERAGQVHFWTAPRRPVRFHRYLAPWSIIALIATCFFLVSETRSIVRHAERTKSLNWPTCLMTGALVDVLMSGMALVSGWPVAICDRGIAAYREVTRWRQFRDATWEVERPDVLRLHSVDGATSDFRVVVPPRDRAHVESFVKERIAATRDAAN